jgi:hypothetical protein
MASGLVPVASLVWLRAIICMGVSSNAVFVVLRPERLSFHMLPERTGRRGRMFRDISQEWMQSSNPESLHGAFKKSIHQLGRTRTVLAGQPVTMGSTIAWGGQSERHVMDREVKGQRCQREKQCHNSPKQAQALYTTSNCLCLQHRVCLSAD